MTKTPAGSSSRRWMSSIALATRMRRSRGEAWWKMSSNARGSSSGRACSALTAGELGSGIGTPLPGLSHFGQRILEDGDREPRHLLQPSPRLGDALFLFGDEGLIEGRFGEEAIARNGCEVRVDNELGGGGVAADVPL